MPQTAPLFIVRTYARKYVRTPRLSRRHSSRRWLAKNLKISDPPAQGRKSFIFWKMTANTYVLTCVMPPLRTHVRTRTDKPNLCTAARLCTWHRDMF